jgi:8-oxo-dGTP pyrophosphatase MutT (NUDIX family)
VTLTLEKVVAFITRQTPHAPELLLFEHPHAGIQIPAGTVEQGEAPEAAVLREGREETGLIGLRLVRALGHRDDSPPEGCAAMARSTTVYARPDTSSFDWARLPRAAWVRTERHADGFTQVSYIEHDSEPNREYVSYQITGWVPDKALTRRQVRHFYHLDYPGDAPPRWTVRTDNHRFTLFWARLDALPPIIPPQNTWLDVLAQPFPDLRRRDG